MDAGEDLKLRNDLFKPCPDCQGRMLVQSAAGGKQEACPRCEGRGKLPATKDDFNLENMWWRELLVAVLPFFAAYRGDRALQDSLRMQMCSPTLEVEEMHPWYFMAATLLLDEFNTHEREHRRKEAQKQKQSNK